MSFSIQNAIAAVNNGGVIAYPTEAVYGFGCNPRCISALEKIISLKARNIDKGLILVASDQGQLAPFLATIDPSWQQRFDQAWPGPTTFVVPAANNVSPLLTGGRTTLAVRVSSHPTIIQLCQVLGHALVSTSANRSGQHPLCTQQQVYLEFGNDIDVVTGGDTGPLNQPTTIIDVRTGITLR